MTRVEHLLAILVEECCEVGQRATKALRFGLQEVQSGHDYGTHYTNAYRILEEYADLAVAVELLVEEGYLPKLGTEAAAALFARKRERIEKYYRYSAEVGTVTTSQNQEKTT